MFAESFAFLEELEEAGVGGVGSFSARSSLEFIRTWQEASGSAAVRFTAVTGSACLPL